MAMVELNGVSRSFSKGDETITPLDNVSLKIQEGEFVSLMGPAVRSINATDQIQQRALARTAGPQ